jgi:uncharacterized membrane protein YeaQ/YmgE (transglycosylase-associated protein family)
MPHFGPLEPYKLYVILCFVGLIAGWLSGLLLGGGGLLRNLVVGILGAIVGGLLVNMKLLPGFDVATYLPAVKGVPLINEIAVATLGAIIVTIVARVIAGSRR